MTCRILVPPQGTEPTSSASNHWDHRDAFKTELFSDFGGEAGKYPDSE